MGVQERSTALHWLFCNYPYLWRKTRTCKYDLVEIGTNAVRRCTGCVLVERCLLYKRGGSVAEQAHHCHETQLGKMCQLKEDSVILSIEISALAV